MALDLQYQLTVDTQDAVKNIQSVEGAAKSTEGAIGRVDKSVDGLTTSANSFGSRANRALEGAKSRFEQVRNAVVAVGTALAGTLVAIRTLGDAANAMSINPVDRRSVDAANKALGGTVDQLTLIRSLQQTNLSSAQFADAAKVAAFMAKQFGFSKEAMLQMVLSGNVMETQLQALGISSKAMENRVSQAKNAMGGMGGELDKVTESQIRFKVLMEAVQRASKNFTANTKQAGDESAKLLATLKDQAIQLGTKLLPAMNLFVKAISTAVDWFKMLMKIGDSIGDVFGDVYLKIVGAKKDGPLKETKVFDDAINALEKMGPAKLKEQMAAVAKQEKETNKAKEQAIKLEKDRQDALQKRKRLQEELKRQALEEQRQLQEQARDLLRNYVEKAAQTIADAGGSFGTIASAMTDVFEKFRIFSAVPALARGLSAAVKIANEAQGDMSKNLSFEIDKRRESLKLTTQQAQAAKLLLEWIRGGADDTAEFLANEKAATEQMRASLSVLQSASKVAQLKTEELNIFKDVTQFAKGADRLIKVVQAKRGEILEQMASKGVTQARQTELGFYGAVLMRLERTKAQFDAIAKTRMQILRLSQAHAAIEADIEVTTKKISNIRSVEDANKGLADANARLRAARGRDNPVEDVERQGAATRQAIQREIVDLTLKAETLQRKLQAGFADPKSQGLAQKELEGIQRVIDTKQRQLSIEQQITDAQVRRLTLVGQLQQQFAVSAVQFAQASAQQIKSSFDSVVGSFGSAMADVISGAIQGDKDIGRNFGKATLDALANLALQWGAFFTIQGAGMLASYQPTGAAVIAAGVGLVGLAGVLKGASGLLGASKSAPSTGSGGSARTEIPGARQPREREQTTAYILVTNSIYGSEEQQARYLRGFVERNKRSMGGRRI